MEKQNLEKLGPAGDTRFVTCYRCPAAYDQVAHAYCPACQGCGECGCCPCDKPTCEWCGPSLCEICRATHGGNEPCVEPEPQYQKYDLN